MRILLLSVMGLGAVIVLGTAFLVIDRAITPDQREAVRSSLGDAVYDLAEAHDNQEGVRSRSIEGRVGKIAATLRDLNEGVFKTIDLDLAAAMPPAPEGWELRPYTTADGAAITGETYVQSFIVSTSTNSLLGDFEGADGSHSLKRAMTYSRDGRLVALLMRSSMEAIRRGEAGETRASQVTAPYALVEGIPVKLHSQFATDHRSGRSVPVNFRHFTLDLDGQMEILIMTNAADADVLALLGGIDLAALHAGLPVRTTAYSPGAGVTFAGGLPSTEPPAPSRAMLALAHVRNGMTAETPEGRVVHGIAEGRVSGWNDASRAARGRVEPTPVLVELLGPPPGE